MAAQDVAIPGPNMKATLEAIGAAAGSPPLSDALASGTILSEIATAPLSSGASGLTSSCMTPPSAPTRASARPSVRLLPSGH